MHVYHLYQHIAALILFAVFSYALTAIDDNKSEQQPEQQIFDLNVVIPGSDTTTVSLARHRIAANTDPDARAFINDEEVTVYPTGAFVGLVDLPTGKSSSEIRVESKDGDIRTKTLHFRRPEPPKTTPSEPLVIEDQMMQPRQTLELDKDETIELRFKASAGQQAYFSIDGVVEEKPMREQPLSQTGGIGGIYKGKYTVQADDHVRQKPVTFILRDEQGNEATKDSPRPISMTPDAFPKVAEIESRRAFLNSGSGTDRLGGARLGFLEKGVRLEITGREGNLYRVRLSGNMNGYVPMRFVRLLPENTSLPRSLTGSATASGNTRYDMVTLSLGQRLPYISKKRTDPNIIEIDIFGADSNTNWITHHKSAEGIHSVDWDQVTSNHFRLRIHLKHDTHWGYHVGYGVGSSLRIQVQRPPLIRSEERPLQDQPIAIDVGHGGSNRGALGATGTKEKDIVMDISQNLKKTLKDEGARVFMTRERDISVPMLERSEMLIASDAKAMVSIHANSIGYATNPDNVQGTSSYYRHQAFRPLAAGIHDRMLELPLQDFGLIGSFNFTLNALTQMPNALVETAFISHPGDEMMLLDPEYQQKMAEKITEGLRDYFRRYGQKESYVPEVVASP